MSISRATSREPRAGQPCRPCGGGAQPAGAEGPPAAPGRRHRLPGGTASRGGCGLGGIARAWAQPGWASLRRPGPWPGGGADPAAAGSAVRPAVAAGRRRRRCGAGAGRAAARLPAAPRRAAGRAAASRRPGGVAEPALAVPVALGGRVGRVLVPAGGPAERHAWNLNHDGLGELVVQALLVRLVPELPEPVEVAEERARATPATNCTRYRFAASPGSAVTLGSSGMTRIFMVRLADRLPGPEHHLDVVDVRSTSEHDSTNRPNSSNSSGQDEVGERRRARRSGAVGSGLRTSVRADREEEDDDHRDGDDQR